MLNVPGNHNAKDSARTRYNKRISILNKNKRHGGGQARARLGYAAPGRACAGRVEDIACLVPKHPNPGATPLCHRAP